MAKGRRTICSFPTEILKPETIGDFIYYSASEGDKILDSYSEEVHKYGPSSESSFLAHIRNILSNQSTIKHEEKKRVILVLDDAVSRPFFPKTTKSDSPLAQFMINCRHIPANIIITSQKLNDLSPWQRSNSSHMFIWPTKSKIERSAIINEAGGSDPKNLEAALDSLHENETLWIDKKRGVIHKGFNQTLIH